MNEIRPRYKMGKFTCGLGRFVGKQVDRLSDGSMMIQPADSTGVLCRREDPDDTGFPGSTTTAIRTLQC